MENLIFLAHAGTTLYLVGVIWVVQILHYPLLENVGADGYAKYHNRHTKRITPVVAPAMILELLTAIYFVFVSFQPVIVFYFYIGLALILIIWISTFFVQVPLHEKLGANFNPDAQRRLVSTNWIRTAAWTLRGALVLWMIWLKIK
ncbi:MAG TPA: hypothetical protein VK308_07765 [Pyrinomonadaceae bacterium]|nr:hypothetical protein [Pyrinomonadaceae bacterium]